jgi:deoxyribonuclease-4
MRGIDMVEFIAGAHVSSSGGIFNAIGNGEEIEAEAIQIFASPPQTWRQTNHKPEAIEKFKTLHADSNVGDVWIHNIYLANLAAEDPEQLKKSIDSVQFALRIADAIGAEGVVLHTGSHKGRGMDAVADQVTEALIEILKDAPGTAILALEDMAGQGGQIGKEFGELGMLLKRVQSDRLQVCVDTAHAFAAGYDIGNAEGLEVAITEFDQVIGLDHLAVVHANDSKIDLGGQRDRHENIGEGFIGMEGFEAITAHPAFADKAFLLEVPGFEGEEGKAKGPDLENVDRLKRLRAGTAVAV